MREDVWRLFWRDRPVCLLRGVERGDWPFLDAAFDPGEFPKDLAEALAQTLRNCDHDEGDEEDGEVSQGPTDNFVTG